MNRLALLFLVGFLAASTGGILDLVLPEPCSPSESATSPSDGSCPSTCVRCHCAHAFDFTVQLEVSDPPARIPEWRPPWQLLPQLFSRDILHVPKLAAG